MKAMHTLSHRAILAAGVTFLAAMGLATTPSPAHASALLPTIPHVWVGYADNVRPAGGTFPSPWQGDPNTVFLGAGGGPPPSWDTGAIQLDNTTGSAPVDVSDVSVDVWGQVVDLWGAFTIPASHRVILAQTALYNFDSSDFNSNPCGSYADPTNNPPTITVTFSDGSTATYTDSGHILDTGGFDYACIGNEATQWTGVGGGAVGGSATLTLKANQPNPSTCTTSNLVATLTGPDGSPLADSPISFADQKGPNKGTIGNPVFTDANGQATVAYLGDVAGTDTDIASFTSGGSTLQSNAVSVVWTGSTTSCVGVFDFYYSPHSLSAPVGTTVRFLSYSASGNACVNSKVGLFTEPSPFPNGSEFDQQLVAAGSYQISCSKKQDGGTKMAGVIHVGVQVTPSTGHATDTFEITYASAAVSTLGSNFVENLFVKVPGATGYTPISGAQGLVGTDASYSPGSGASTGKYDIAAELENMTTGVSTLLSPAAVIKIS